LGTEFFGKEYNLINEVAIIVRKKLHAPVKSRAVLTLNVIKSIFDERDRINNYLKLKN